MSDPSPPSALSIEDLRRILRRPELTNEQLQQISDDLHCFARVLIEGYLREKRERLSRKPQ